MKKILSMTAAVVSLSLPMPVLAESWTPAWMASPQAVWQDTTVFATGLPEHIGGATIRQPLTLGFPSDSLRLVFSNTYGTRPLPIAAVSIAQSAGGAATDTARMILFSGSESAVIPPGATLVSDPAAFAAKAGSRIAVTITYGTDAMAEDFHWDARETSYLIDGDTEAPDILGEIPARLTLSAVLTDQPAKEVVIAMGDSITDGNGAPMDAMARWPDFLARALSDKGIAVVNAGISGGRLLSDGMGRSVLARLEHDALTVPGADTLVLLIGTNDIAWPGTPFSAEETPMRLDRLQDGLTQVAARIHAQGMRLILGTVPPFAGALPETPMEATYWTPEKDALRRDLNDWLRGADFFDGLVDFDRVLSAPGDDMRMSPLHDSGDHLHPSANGNRAMAQAVAETLLKGQEE